jgi:hypothetical protein
MIAFLVVRWSGSGEPRRRLVHHSDGERHGLDGVKVALLWGGFSS